MMRRALSGILLTALLALSFPVASFAQSDEAVPPPESSPGEMPVEESVPASTDVEAPPVEELSVPPSEELPTTLEEIVPEPQSEFVPLEAAIEAAAVPAPTPFTGIGQLINNARSDHMDSGKAYLGQIGIRFSAPGYVRYIVVYPDIDDPDFINCADTRVGNNTANVIFGQDMGPWGGERLFLPVSEDVRADGGCLYQHDGGGSLFVYPGATYNLALNNGSGSSVAFEYLGSEETVAETLGRAYLSNQSGAEWGAPSASLDSLSFLISTTDAPPPDGGVPEEAAYTPPEGPGVTLEELANYVVLAEGPEPTENFGQFNISSPLNIPQYFKESGTVKYVRMQLGYFYDAADAEFSFSLNGRDCQTPSKKLFEWGIANRTRGGNWSNVIIGPFSGTDCSFTPTPLDRPWEGQITVRASDSSINRDLSVKANGRSNLMSMAVYAGEPQISSILFLPGFLGSRLYAGNRLLWEPNAGDDIRDLAMNVDGTSKLSVHVGDVVDEIRINGVATPLGTVYKNIMEWMEGLVEEGTIAGERAFSYDWRYDVLDVIDDGVLREDGSREYLIPLVEQMAASSTTKNLTIIGHSNGGLLAKALMIRLAELGKEDLIDRVILIGSPEVGTPKSMLGLLHGQDIVKPFIALNGTARASAATMPGAYGLLPSPMFFTMDPEPVATFEPGNATDPYRNVLGETIENYATLVRFLSNDPETREMPEIPDEETPYPLSPALIARAEATHALLDAWTPPSGVSIHEIAGWGNETIVGARYFTESSYSCPDGFFSCGFHNSIDFKPIISVDGDDTVVSSSALFQSSGVYFDLQFLGSKSGEQRKHQDLTESSLLHDYLENLLGLGTPFEFSMFISDTPESVSQGTNTVSVHSPVLLHLEDEDGAKTGIFEIPGTDLYYTLEEIPGSSVFFGGEGKYVSVPADGEYDITVEGIGTGLFSLVIESEDETIKEFSNLPTSSNTIATTQLSGDTVAPLALDTNGDGKVETNITGETLSRKEAVKLCRDEIGRVPTLLVRLSLLLLYRDIENPPKLNALRERALERFRAFIATKLRDIPSERATAIATCIELLKNTQR